MNRYEKKYSTVQNPQATLIKVFYQGFNENPNIKLVYVPLNRIIRNLDLQNRNGMKSWKRPDSDYSVQHWNQLIKRITC